MRLICTSFNETALGKRLQLLDILVKVEENNPLYFTKNFLFYPKARRKQREKRSLL